MATTHFAFIGARQIGKRVSQNRVYTHCIATKRSYDHDLKQAQEVSRNDRSNFDFYMREAGYTDEESKYSIDYSKSARDHLGDARDFETFKKRLVDARLLRVQKNEEAGVYDEWTVQTWCSRIDLAQKKLGEYRSPYYSDAVIVEVTHGK